MKLFIFGLCIISFLICYSACAVPKTKEEQRQDDEAQMKYLKEIKENLDNKVRGQVCLKVAEDNNV